MTIALRDFNEVHTPIQRLQEDSNLRVLLVICGMIAVPSLLLVVLLSGWVQYLFVAIVAVNVAVPVIAYLASLNPPRSLPQDDYPLPRSSQLSFEEVKLSEQVPAEKVSDQV